MTDRLTEYEPAPERSDQADDDVTDVAGETSENDRADHLDLGAGAEEPVGDDNIREGTVGGVMGGPRQQGGEGQGG
jgi:hypothetical protein